MDGQILSAKLYDCYQSERLQSHLLSQLFYECVPTMIHYNADNRAVLIPPNSYHVQIVIIISVIHCVPYYNALATDQYSV